MACGGLGIGIGNTWENMVKSGHNIEKSDDQHGKTWKIVHGIELDWRNHLNMLKKSIFRLVNGGEFPGKWCIVQVFMLRNLARHSLLSYALADHILCATMMDSHICMGHHSSPKSFSFAA